MKKIISGFLIGIILTFCVGVYAADIKLTAVKSTISIIFQGKQVKLLNPVVKINGIYYAPIKDLSASMGIKYFLDAKGNKINLGEAPSPKPSITILPATLKFKGLLTTLMKVEQDEDSLRLYFTYTNNSDETKFPYPMLTKIVCNGKQYEYDPSFNVERYYDNPHVDHLDGSIEPGVTANTVVFFKPIVSIDKINIVTNVEFEDIKFNNVKVEIK